MWRATEIAAALSEAAPGHASAPSFASRCIWVRGSPSSPTVGRSDLQPRAQGGPRQLRRVELAAWECDITGPLASEVRSAAHLKPGKASRAYTSSRDHSAALSSGFPVGPVAWLRRWNLHNHQCNAGCRAAPAAATSPPRLRGGPVWLTRGRHAPQPSQAPRSSGGAWPHQSQKDGPSTFPGSRMKGCDASHLSCGSDSRDTSGVSLRAGGSARQA